MTTTTAMKTTTTTTAKKSEKKKKTTKEKETKGTKTTKTTIKGERRTKEMPEAVAVEKSIVVETVALFFFSFVCNIARILKRVAENLVRIFIYSFFGQR